MNTKHTPGPLEVSRDQTYRAQWTVTKSHGHQPNQEQAGIGHVVATARCYTEADAILYAAAPDLLAALYQIDANAAESVEWIRRVARAAIAKATGGSL